MKVFLLFIVLAFSEIAIAQDYKPLLDNYNEWNLRYCYIGNPCTSDIYYTNGDTIVDGMTFKVLDGYHYISRGFLLREDVAERKVYLKAILPGTTRDYLLYDFSLSVGDSMDIKNPVTPFPENAGYFKIDSIKLRPLVDGNEYRHFYLSPTPSNTISTNNAIWVEGVGSLSIITAPGGDPDVNGVGRVACMFKNGESFYSDLTIIDACEATFTLNTNDFETGKSEVKIINTGKGKQFEVLNIEEFNTINIFNLHGSKIGSYNTNHQKTMHLDLSNYQAALYIVVLESDKNQHIHTLKIFVE